MLKVCHITSAHPRYDIRILTKECISLADAKYDVSLIVADDKPDEVINGVKIYSVGKPLSRKYRMHKTPQIIYAKIATLKPDIVHFHDPELMFLGIKLARHKFKVIYDVHEDLPKQVMNKHWLPKFIRPFISLVVRQIERYCAKNIVGIITATPIIEDRFRTYNSNTRAVCNYPLLRELNPSNDIAWDTRQNRICYIGSISKTRGIIPLVESLAISKIVLDLAGIFSGDVTLDELKSLSGGEYINYLGILDRQQIIALLQKVKIGMVTLLPTPSYVESLPIKMFEYMLSGIPVIASNFPLWDSIIAHYNCGVLVDPTDKIAIANACNELLANDEAAKLMGERGKNVVKQSFNWEAEKDKLLAFYGYVGTPLK